jgi:hypothetical protein
MDKSFIVFVTVGIGFLYFITNFVNDIEKDDGYPTQTAMSQDDKYAKYIKYDSIGRPVLDIKGVALNVQKDVWRHSNLREDFLSFYPDYDEMKKFIKERIVGDEFQAYMLEQVSLIEKDFLMGRIDSDQAEIRLESL